SSVVASGITLTLNIAITFQPAFIGSKNVYVEAGSSFQTPSWTQKGTWTLAPTVNMSVSPASGGGPNQIFSFQVTDGLGANDISTVGILFNTSASATSGCAVMYNRAQNALTLLTDSGSAPAGFIAPGSGTQQNSQCTLNGSGSSVTAVGTTLTLNLSLNFQTSWVGTKNTYMQASNPYQSATWVLAGKWVTSASLSVSATPTSGSGTQATFSVKSTESWGATNVTTSGIMVNSSASVAGGCVVTYNWSQNALMLLSDAGTAPA